MIIRRPAMPRPGHIRSLDIKRFSRQRGQTPGNNALALATADAVNQDSYDHPVQVGEFIADYPNYISPGVSGHRVWGDNVKRSKRIKQNYDPDCMIRKSRVFASYGCILGGWANDIAGVRWISP